MHTLELCCYLFLKDVRLHQESGWRSSATAPPMTMAFLSAVPRDMSTGTSKPACAILPATTSALKVRAMLEKYIEQDASGGRQSFTDQLKELNGEKMMRNPLFRGCIDDDGVIGSLAARQKRCTIVDVAGDLRGERKIQSREGDGMRITVISTMVPDQSALASIVPSVPPPHPIISISWTGICASRPNMACT